MLSIFVLAFALQSYITQTHIHDGTFGFGGTFKIEASQSPAHGKKPLDPSSADCPLCQAIVHVGLFVNSAPPLLHLPFMWVQTVALAFTAPSALDAVAHDWRSRAPPRL